jgi:AraC-like DNA-binding protein
VNAALLFDAAAVPAAERFAAVQDLLVRSSHPTTLDPAGTPDPAAIRFRAWATAPDSVLFASAGPGLRLQRRETRRHYDDEPLFALTTQSSGRAWVVQNNVTTALLPGSLGLVDLGAAYDYTWSGMGSSVSYQLTMEAVGLQRAEIETAAPRLSASPLGCLVRETLTDIAARAQAGAPVYQELHQAMADLARALVISVLPDDPPRSMPDDDTVLWAALCSYIRRHLHEPSLDIASAAESMGVARERLRRVAEGHGVEVNDLIRTRRLQKARSELAGRPARIMPARAALASTAARWGFASPERLLEAMASAQRPAGVPGAVHEPGY